MKNSLLLSLLLLSLPVLGTLSDSIRRKDGSPLKLEDVSNLNSMTLALPSEVLLTRNVDTQISVLHDKEGFMVADNETITRVKLRDLSPELRNMDVKKSIAVLTNIQLQVSKLSNGEYAIDKTNDKVDIRQKQQNHKLKNDVFEEYKLKPALGGDRKLKHGLGGAMAGFWICKGAVYLVGHGSIIAAGIGSGPWGFVATVGALELSYGAQIEVASNVAGHHGAVFGLFATGPA